MCLYLVIGAFAGGNDGPTDLGVSRGTRLSEFTDDDARRACESVQDEDFELNLSHRQECTLAGVFYAETQTDCIVIRDNCLAEEPEPDPTPTPEDCSGASASETASCTATVGDVEDWFNAQVSETRAYYNGLDCSDVGADNEPPTVVKCQQLASQCPELFGDVVE